MLSQQQLAMIAQYNYYYLQQYQNVSPNLYALQRPQIQYVPVSYQPTIIYKDTNPLEDRNKEILNQMYGFFLAQAYSNNYFKVNITFRIII